MPYYDHIRKQRKAIQNMTKPLKLWLYRNKTHPYPTKQDKMVLASQANMTMTQVTTPTSTVYHLSASNPALGSYYRKSAFSLEWTRVKHDFSR